ncbi:ComEA family DNA-binding protein [Paramicrobacterium fandaimingii]|uniref:ComEA family DNA-binding protein n=1 Tax=Paramicrobacterium fandaimingii TaxID=2708079 RepID=UPI0014233B5C|nr:ComEA family DNA-binding protein [Microbacterium fandaimingii]
MHERAELSRRARRPKRLRLGAGVAVLLMLAGLSAAVVIALVKDGEHVSTVQPHNTFSTSIPAVIYVHVLGAVASPGLYQLSDGARVMDAVAAAGGLTDDADEAAINLARFVTDGEQVRVPEVGETAEQQEGKDAQGRVNLNTATAEQLEELPNIGPALAERIIAWRDDNGGFRSVDDLRNVSGIGEKTFATLKDLVTV